MFANKHKFYVGSSGNASSYDVTSINNLSKIALHTNKMILLCINGVTNTDTSGKYQLVIKYVLVGK